MLYINAPGTVMKDYRIHHHCPPKPRKQKIPLVIKRLVWHKCIGKEKGTAMCPCCNITEIEQMSFSCGHIQSEYNGGKIEVDNLIPICNSCNSSMGTMDYDQFKLRYKLVDRILPSPIVPCSPPGTKLFIKESEERPLTPSELPDIPDTKIQTTVYIPTTVKLSPSTLKLLPSELSPSTVKLLPSELLPSELSPHNVFYNWKCPN